MINEKRRMTNSNRFWSSIKRQNLCTCWCRRPTKKKLSCLLWKRVGRNWNLWGIVRSRRSKKSTTTIGCTCRTDRIDLRKCSFSTVRSTFHTNLIFTKKRSINCRRGRNLNKLGLLGTTFRNKRDTVNSWKTSAFLGYQRGSKNP